MTVSLRIVLIIITIIYLTLIITSVKKRKMQTSIATFWILTGILLIVAVVIPNFIESISSILGFEQTSNMIFCLTIFISFCALLYLTMLLAGLTQKCITLIQEVSVLKDKVEYLEKKIKK